MPGDDALYGFKTANIAAKGTSTNVLPADSCFSSKLTSLLADASSTTAHSQGTRRARASKTSRVDKENDIFSKRNRGTQQRALADQADGNTSVGQVHSTSSEKVDASTLARARRKMEEKARLYDSMKRGDYVPPSNGAVNKEVEGLVDFDRKWAEKEERGEQDVKAGDYDSDDYSDASDGNGDDDLRDLDSSVTITADGLVQYEDELGRTRTGTRAQVARFLRQRNAASYASDELAALSARPARPQNVIVGDTIQSAAFNPDAPAAAQMENLARKRDRSMTPPEEVHYDATKEIRSKGVGFYQFSKDAESRKQEMHNLEQEREQTEHIRQERQDKLQEKKRRMEEKKKMIAEVREKRMADQFLNQLDAATDQASS